jgi:hypothetical protein
VLHLTSDKNFASRGQFVRIVFFVFFYYVRLDFFPEFCYPLFMTLLGYKTEDAVEMIYGIESAILLIDTNDNPAIHRYLSNAADLLRGLIAEGRI